MPIVAGLHATRVSAKRSMFSTSASSSHKKLGRTRAEIGSVRGMEKDVEDGIGRA